MRIFMIFNARLNNFCVFIRYLDDRRGTVVTGITAAWKVAYIG
jgi:hypothetical protein